MPFPPKALNYFKTKWTVQQVETKQPRNSKLLRLTGSVEISIVSRKTKLGVQSPPKKGTAGTYSKSSTERADGPHLGVRVGELRGRTALRKPATQLNSNLLSSRVGQSDLLVKIKLNPLCRMVIII